MKKRKWILPVSIVGGVIVLCIVAIFAFGAILSAQGYGISTGRLYFADNGTYLIDSDDMAMRVSDCSDDAELFKGYQNGDKVILFHDGVNETYPAQMLMYGKEASNRKQEIDRQHYTIPNQRPKDKHCGKI